MFPILFEYRNYSRGSGKVKGKIAHINSTQCEIVRLYVLQRYGEPDKPFYYKYKIYTILQVLFSLYVKSLILPPDNFNISTI